MCPQNVRPSFRTSMVISPNSSENIFVGTLGSWSGSHIDCDCTVLHKNLPLILLKQGFDLRNGLQNRDNRNIPSPDRSHQRFRFTWFWSCIKFIGPQSDMNGQCPSTFMICRMDQHIKHGGIKHGNQKLKDGSLSGMTRNNAVFFPEYFLPRFPDFESPYHQLLKFF